MECPLCYDIFRLYYMVIPSCKHAVCRHCYIKINCNKCCICRQETQGKYIIKDIKDELLLFV